jgi:hypothetical protein
MKMYAHLNIVRLEADSCSLLFTMLLEVLQGHNDIVTTCISLDSTKVGFTESSVGLAPHSSSWASLTC